MGLFGGKPWWKDKENGWPGKGVRDFFDESQRYYEKGDASTAIQILEWGKRFSLEFGSGGGASRFDQMISTIRDAQA